MSSVLRLQVAKGALVAEGWRMRRMVWRAESDFTTADELLQVIATLPAQDGFDARVGVVLVCLDRSVVQYRVIRELPPVSAGALAKLVELQQSRFFRRNGTPLVTAARWRREAKAERQVADAFAIEATWLDAIADGVHAAGLRLGRVRVSDADLELVPPQQRVRRDLRAYRLTRLLLVANVCLWLMLPAIHVGRLLLAERQADRRLAELRQPAAAVRNARRELDRAGAMTSAIARSSARQMAMARRMAALAAALPDSAYLVSLSLDSAGNGVIGGSAPAAALVMARLERAHGFGGIGLEGEPAQDGATSGRERFTLRVGTGVER